MTESIDLDRFAVDYRDGVNDRQLLQKYGINSREMIAAVKKLISEGKISRQDYFNRKKKIEEYEAKREREFLKSLYQCPICGHIHPTPFKVCPACETDISDRLETQQWFALSQPRGQTAGKPAAPVVVEVPTVRSPSMVEIAQPAASPQVQKTLAAEAPRVPAQVSRPSVKAAQVTRQEPRPPKEVDPYQAVIGMTLDDLKLLPGVPEDRSSGEYVMTEMVKAGDRAVIFKGEDSGDEALPVAVKVFNPELGEDSEYDKILDKIIEYQSTMLNPNVVRILGSGSLESNRALIYEFLPLNVDSITARHAEGLSMDRIMKFLPQILNGLGFCHTHRGKDGVIRKLPHMSLRTSKVLIDEEETILKIDDCGVSMAVMDVRRRSSQVSVARAGNQTCVHLRRNASCPG